MSRLRLDAATLQAYRETDYCVFAEKGIVTLRVAEYSKTLSDLHAHAGANCSVFITACNPFGEVSSSAANRAAMDRLIDRLDQRGISWRRGEGPGPDSAWVPEPSLLAFGVSTDDAQRLCVEFGQNAVVVAGADAVPQLIFHPEITKG